MGTALTLVFLAFVGAHLALVVGLARRGAWGRAIAALVVAPLAPWWGWGEGMRIRTVAWGAALLLYAVGVAVAAAAPLA
jgi:hypothetical protein